MAGGSDTIKSETRQRVLSTLMEVKAKSFGSRWRVGLILTNALTEAVVFEWDLKGLEWVEKGRDEILLLTGESVYRGNQFAYVCFSEGQWRQHHEVQVQTDLVLTPRSVMSVWPWTLDSASVNGEPRSTFFMGLLWGIKKWMHMFSNAAVS